MLTTLSQTNKNNSSLAQTYFISSLQFDREDMSQLYNFFHHPSSLPAQLSNGFSESTAIAIEIDNILKKNQKYETQRKTIHTKYIQDKNLQNYSQELLTLGAITHTRLIEMNNKIKPEVELIIQNQTLSQAEKSIEENKIWEKYQEETKQFLEARDNYDLKCAESILYHTGDSIVEAARTAIEKYKSDISIN